MTPYTHTETVKNNMTPYTHTETVKNNITHIHTERVQTPLQVRTNNRVLTCFSLRIGTRDTHVELIKDKQIPAVNGIST